MVEEVGGGGGGAWVRLSICLPAADCKNKKKKKKKVGVSQVYHENWAQHRKLHLTASRLLLLPSDALHCGRGARQAGRQAGRAAGDNCNAASHWSTLAIRCRGDKKKRREPSRVWRCFFFLREFLANGFGFEMSEVKKRGVEWSGVNI